MLGSVHGLICWSVEVPPQTSLLLSKMDYSLSSSNVNVSSETSQGPQNCTPTGIQLAPIWLKCVRTCSDLILARTACNFMYQLKCALGSEANAQLASVVRLSSRQYPPWASPLPFSRFAPWGSPGPLALCPSRPGTMVFLLGPKGKRTVSKGRD